MPINVEFLNGSNGFRIAGSPIFRSLGEKVTISPDINGDGLDELFIAIENGSANQRNASGSNLVIFGKDFSENTNLVFSVGDEEFTPSLRLDGTQTFGVYARTVASSGDIDGDGLGDLLISNDLKDLVGVRNGGVVFAVSGGQVSQAGKAELELRPSQADGIRRIFGNREESRLGKKIDTIGDFDGDGFDDIVISEGRGTKAHIIFGSEGFFKRSLDQSINRLDKSGLVVISGKNYNESISVSSAGDFNGDGFSDVLIGYPRRDRGNYSSSGELYVLFGAGRDDFSQGQVILNDQNQSSFLKILGPPSSTAGFDIASIGDVNGDGRDDVAISARVDAGSFAGSGRVFVVFGQDPRSIRTEIDLANLKTSEGFVVTRRFDDGGLGSDIAGLGDVNGDGRDDFIVGVEFADLFQARNAGQAAVIFGRPQEIEFGEEISISSLRPTDGFIINGFESEGTLGDSVGGGGDVNGDGINDIIVGASRTDSGFGNFSGSAFVIFGEQGIGGTAIGIVGSDESEILDGTISSEVIEGLRGADTLFGSSGNDTLIGGTGRDELFSGSGRDVSFGGGGRDAIFGGRGRDSLDGGRGRDELVGGGGRDFIEGGKGRDELSGGGGGDRFVFGPRDGIDRIIDFQQGRDKLVLEGAVETFEQLRISQSGDDVLIRIVNTRVVIEDDIVEAFTANDFIF